MAAQPWNTLSLRYRLEAAAHGVLAHDARQAEQLGQHAVGPQGRHVRVALLGREEDKLPERNDSSVVSGCALLNVAYLIGETKVKRRGAEMGRKQKPAEPEPSIQDILRSV